MPGDTHSKDPFDDRAALEELERLKRSIQSYRQRREQAAGAFDQIIGGFHEPPAEVRHPEKGTAAAPSPANAAAPAIASGVLSVSPPSPSPPAPAPNRSPFPDRLPATLPESRAGDLFADRPAASADREIFGETTPSRGRLPLVAGILLAMVVGFVVTMRLRQAAEPAPAATVQTAPVPAAAAGQPPSAAPQPASDRTIPQPAGGTGATDPASQSVPSPAPAAIGNQPSSLPAAPSAVTSVPPTAAPGITPSSVPASTPGVTAPAAGGPAPPAEIRTVRRAWVRVTVDGKRELERELEAGVRIPLPAGATYVVRAGDAGAVHLLLNGQDQGPLGADAQVVTRSYPAR